MGKQLRLSGRQKNRFHHQDGEPSVFSAGRTHDQPDRSTGSGLRHWGDHVPGNPADIFEWCVERDQHELVKLPAFAAAHAVDVVKDKYDFRKTQRVHAEKLAQALDLDMTTYFEATAESYFSYLTRDGIEAALTEIKGPEFASGISRMKKAEAYAEAQAKGTAWLPSPIRPVIAKVDESKATSPETDADEDRDDLSDDAAGGNIINVPEAAA